MQRINGDHQTAVEWGCIEANPVRMTRLPRRTRIKAKAVLTPEQGRNLPRTGSVNSVGELGTTTRSLPFKPVRRFTVDRNDLPATLTID
jgi:hypothetical protein